MAKRTVVSVYEVDEWGTSGPWAGQGSLVHPTLVLVHPPLSTRIVAGEGIRRFRVGIFNSPEVSFPTETPPLGYAEVIDVWGEPHVHWKDESTVLSVVSLELRASAKSPVYSIPEAAVFSIPNESSLRTIAEHLKELAKNDSSPHLIPPLGAAFWCRMLPNGRGC